MKYLRTQNPDGSISYHEISLKNIVDIPELVTMDEPTPTKEENSIVPGWLYALFVIIVIGFIAYGGASFR